MDIWCKFKFPILHSNFSIVNWKALHNSSWFAKLFLLHRAAQCIFVLTRFLVKITFVNSATHLRVNFMLTWETAINQKISFLNIVWSNVKITIYTVILTTVYLKKRQQLKIQFLYQEFLIKGDVLFVTKLVTINICVKLFLHNSVDIPLQRTTANQEMISQNYW